MSNKYRIVSAICIVVLFTVNSVLGSYMSDLINLTDENENFEEDTPIERAIEAGICDYCDKEKYKEPGAFAEIPVQTPVPVSTPKPSPGTGIPGILTILSAIYIILRKS